MNHFINPNILIIVFFLGFACSSPKEKIITKEDSIQTEGSTTIKIPCDYDNLLQIDTIFDSISIVPLETNKNCLISSISKTMINGDCIYIQNRSDNLFVFTKTGRFIREIGEKGKGPGEFMELRDFDIDDKGNIYILDFLNIKKYSTAGRFLEKYQFDYSPHNAITCNPLQFALGGVDDFYIWGGSLSIKNNQNSNLFLMYKMNKKGKIVERYFPLTHKAILNLNQFSKFSNYYNVVPWYGCNIIHKVDSKGVSVNYILDFDKLTFSEKVPENFEDLSEFKAIIDQRYANSINNIVETSDWLYFMFSYKKYKKNVYYSKKLKRVFVSKPYPRVHNRIMPWMIHTSDGNNLIALIEPRIILEDLDKMEAGQKEKINICNLLKETSINSNPIMLVCKMRKY